MNTLNNRKRRLGSTWATQLEYYLMAAIPIIYLFVFNYLPMFGVSIAFMDFKPTRGFERSEVVGWENFEYFFQSEDAVRVIRNTLLYNLVFLLVVGLFVGLLFAILLYEIRSRIANKVYQTAMLLPYFLSWVVVSAVLLVFLNPDNGIVNSILESMGLERISWYKKPEYWPVILTIAEIWKTAGMASIYFYAGLLDVDTSLFEAASLDGAGRLKQIWHVSLPKLKPIVSVVLISRLGRIMTASFESFYQLPLHRSELLGTTDVISTYLFDCLDNGLFGEAAAVGLIQSLVGLVLVIIANMIIKKVDPDSAMF